MLPMRSAAIPHVQALAVDTILSDMCVLTYRMNLRVCHAAIDLEATCPGGRLCPWLGHKRLGAGDSPAGRGQPVERDRLAVQDLGGQGRAEMRGGLRRLLGAGQADRERRA